MVACEARKLKDLFHGNKMQKNKGLYAHGGPHATMDINVPDQPQYSFPQLDILWECRRSDVPLTHAVSYNVR